LNEKYENLFSFPGVTGFGYGKKITNGQPTAKEALLVFVRKKLPLEKLQENEIIPVSIDGITTDVIEIGEVVAHGGKEGQNHSLQDSLDKLMPGFWRQEIIKLENVDGIQKLFKQVRTDLEKILSVKQFFRDLNVQKYQNRPRPSFQELSRQVSQDLKKFGQLKDLLLSIDPDLYKNLLKSLALVFNFQRREGLNKKATVSRTAVLRPAPPGVSIGHYRGGTGTFGAVVYDRKNGGALILSNNHVLANASLTDNQKAKLNDPIIQPGPDDGQGKEIARLARYAALNPYPKANVVDCAVAKPNNPQDITPEILDIGEISGIAEAVIGMQIQKSGRTTGVTTGKVIAVGATINVNYGNGLNLVFENQIVASAMSQAGDSGSLVLDMDHHAVGLLFAGSDSSTIINPIDPVLDLLEVTL
jgi:hypothetical protein